MGGQASEASSNPPYSRYSLNHLPRPSSLGKLSFVKLVPGAEKVGDHCPKEMLPIIHKGHLWEPCLPGKEHQAEIPLFSSQETLSRPTCEWLQGRRKQAVLPPQADGSQQVFDFAPSSLSIKGAWILTQARWFFGT